ncbi:hypothetical protein IGI04_029855 [Brassica rapa subsp. trilocularis]|uniref:Uncharacterized protein n=1 Tax=Brassica rapa subsp. trilocularis TaxID=1813537 RepID=A0ABQ7LP56_BRACM|nr:hypothetical protein IGI04_029855 [Brassica rapa subsp. trilocularis]
MYLAWQLGVEVLPMWRLALEMLAFSNQVSQADSPSFSKVGNIEVFARKIVVPASLLPWIYLPTENGTVDRRGCLFVTQQKESSGCDSQAL